MCPVTAGGMSVAHMQLRTDILVLGIAAWASSQTCFWYQYRVPVWALSFRDIGGMRIVMRSFTAWYASQSGRNHKVLEALAAPRSQRWVQGWAWDPNG